MSKDGESFFYTELDMSGKNIDQLNKAVEEAKEVLKANFNTNAIPDPTFLKELQNLVHLDLGNNKVKNLNIFVADDVLIQLKYLDLSNN